MGIATIGMMQRAGLVAFVKNSYFCKIRYPIVKQWEIARSAHRRLWWSYDNTDYAYKIPKFVWRRHAAYLLYVRDTKAMSVSTMKSSRNNNNRIRNW